MVTEEFPEGAHLRWNVLGMEREESPFSSILISCYWAMVTFTTVGYGDLVPTSPFGRFVALILMYTGILVLALPISVIGANFQREYERLEGNNDDDDSIESQDIWNGARDDGHGDGQSSYPPQRSPAPSRSVNSRSKRDVDRLLKKTLSRERSNTATSIGLSDEIHEAMLPVNDQLKILTSTCVNMMHRIEHLQNQQRVMADKQGVEVVVPPPNDDDNGTGIQLQDVKSELQQTVVDDAASDLSDNSSL
jgi:hypothetical protein